MATTDSNSEATRIRITESDLKDDCYRLNRRLDLIEGRQVSTSQIAAVAQQEAARVVAAAIPTPSGSAPTLESIDPNSGAQDSAVNVTLTGTGFASGATVSTDNAAITVSNVVVVGGTSITAKFTIAAGSDLGGCNVTVTVGLLTSSAVTFTVTRQAAPNVVAGTVAINSYEAWGNEVRPVFSGSMTLASDVSQLQMVQVQAIVPGSDPVQTYDLEGARFEGPFTADAVLDWEGRSGSVLQNTVDQPGWKVQFVCYNLSWEPAANPFVAGPVTILAPTVSGLSGEDASTLDPIDPNYHERWRVGDESPHTVINVHVTQARGNVLSIWFQFNDGSDPLWQGWWPVDGAVVIPIGLQGSHNPDTYAPTHADGSWQVIAAAGSHSDIDPIPVGAVTSVAFSVPMPKAFGPRVITGAYIDEITYAPTGNVEYWGFPHLYFTLPLDDPEFWFGRVTLQTGKLDGPTFTPGGVHKEELAIGDWCWDNNHAEFMTRVPDTNQVYLRNGNWWGLPSDENTCFRFRMYAATRRDDGSGGTKVLQECWSTAVGDDTPGVADHYDVFPNVTITAVTAEEVPNAEYQDSNQGLHTVITVTPTILPDLGRPVKVTVWLDFINDGTENNWIWQGWWDLSTGEALRLGDPTASTEGVQNSGSIWVPTSPDRGTWRVAAAVSGFSGDPPAVSAISSFSVATAASCPANDITNAHFVPNPVGGDILNYLVTQPGKIYWTPYDIEWTQPSIEVGSGDPYYWFSTLTVQKGKVVGGVFTAAPDYEGDNEDDSGNYLGRKVVESATLTGGIAIPESTVQYFGSLPPDWDYPPPRNPDGTANLYRTYRFRIYAVSRLGTDESGGTGVYTLQTCWTGGADHYDVTPSTDESVLDLGQASVGSVGGPLSVSGNKLTVPAKAITNTYLGDSAVQATNMAANAITAANGALAALSVLDSNVDGVHIGKVVAGTVIFSGDVYVARGTGYPLIQLGYLGMYLWSAANTTGTSKLENATATGLTNYPYVNVASTGILVHSGSNKSVLVNSSAIYLYSVNGNTAFPYVGVDANGITASDGANYVQIQSNYVKVANSNGPYVYVEATFVEIVNGTKYVKIESGQITVDGGGGRVSIAPTQVQLTMSGTTATLTSTSLNFNCGGGLLSMAATGISVIDPSGAMLLMSSASVMILHDANNYFSISGTGLNLVIGGMSASFALFSGSVQLTCGRVTTAQISINPGTIIFNPFITSGSATGGGAALPSNPAGFLTVGIGVGSFKIPYYNV